MVYLFMLVAAFIAALLASEFSVAMALIFPMYLFAIGVAFNHMADELDKEEEWE